jgi:hypothetical protein
LINVLQRMSERTRRRCLTIGRWSFFVFGSALLIAACVQVVGEGRDRVSLIDLARNAPINLVIGLVLLPLANLAISAAAFHVLYRRFGRVGFAELVTLMGSAWLLNYLPFKPGMAGRFAYHRIVNGIELKHSFRTLIESMACSGLAAVIGLIACKSANIGEWSDARFMITMCMIAAGLIVSGCIAGRWRGYAGALTIVAGLRIADLIVWTMRYFAAFTIAGSPISGAQACLVACVSQAAMAIPLWGNGLGLREWSVGWVGSGVVASKAATVGLGADLVNRAAELFTALPIGIVCTIVAARRAAVSTTRAGSTIQRAQDAGNDQ